MALSDMWYNFLNLMGLRPPTVAGPSLDEHPIVEPLSLVQAVRNRNAGFTNGLYNGADQYKPANKGRVGGMITPQTIVVHTTDMVGSEDDLIRAWQNTVTSGACAHFLLHRSGFLTQFVPINKNANHAGGPKHGNYRVKGKEALIHPNVVAVGIEIHSGGLLTKTAKGWLHKDSGRIILQDDVYVDAKGRGWQKVTDAQLAKLSWLLDDIKVALAPGNLEVVPDGSYRENGVSDYADLCTGLVAGHVTLDPVNKTDPGTQVMTWLKEHYYNEEAGNRKGPEA